MKNYGIKRTIAAVMSLVIIGGALPGVVGSGIFPADPLTASAEDVTEDLSWFDESTQTLYLNGLVDGSNIAKYNKKVVHVVAEPGTILPQNCDELFRGFMAKEIDLSNADSSNVTSMYNMFYYCVDLESLDLSNLDTSNVTNMGGMFRCCFELSSFDLSSFNTINVTDMSYMFAESGLSSLDLSAFSTRKVIDMSDMFYHSNFTKLDLSSFDTSNVTDMTDMFTYCTSLKTIFVSDSWVTPDDTAIMFYGSSSLVGGAGTEYGFHGTDDTGKYARIDEGEANRGYFTYKEYLCYQFDEETGIVTLRGSVNKDQIETKLMRVPEMNAKVKKFVATEGAFLPADTYSLFGQFDEVTEIDLSKADFTYVNTIGNWFSRCPNLEKVDISGLHHDYVFNMVYAFATCPKLKTIYVSTDADLRNDSLSGYNSNGMFSGCTSLVGGNGTAYDSSHTDSAYARIDGENGHPGYFTEKCCSLDEETGTLHLFGNVSVAAIREYAGDERVKYVYAEPGTVFPKVCNDPEANEGMFEGIMAESMDLSNADVSNVQETRLMFFGCGNLTSLNLSGWDTSGIIDMSEMFEGCYILEELDLSSFDTSNVWNMQYMFANSSMLKTIYVSDLWNMDSVSVSRYMFFNCCDIIGGKGTMWKNSAEDGRRAVIDGTDGKEGYFTDINAFDIAFKHNCSFDSDLSMYYAVPKDAVDGMTDLKLEVIKEEYETGASVPTKSTRFITDYTDQTIGGKEYYMFTYSGITSTDMNSLLNAVLHGTKDGEECQSKVDIYSIKAFALDRLENSSSSTYKKMMVDMLNYGAAAQIHFNKNARFPANHTLSPAQQSLGTQSLPALYNNEKTIKVNGATAQFGKKNIAFQNKTELMLQMKFPEGMNMSKVKLNVSYVTSSGTQVTKKISASKFTKSGDYYIASFNTLAIPDVRSVITFKIMNGSKQISDTLQYSVESYVYNRLSNSDSETYKTLVTEMMKFGISAEEHFS